MYPKSTLLLLLLPLLLGWKVDAFQSPGCLRPLSCTTTTNRCHTSPDRKSTRGIGYSTTRASTSTTRMNLAVSPSSLMWISDATAAAVDGGAATPFWQNSDVWVFLAGIFPFAWATIEFWRRIAVGESFGTGSDSVVISIGMDDAPTDSRGRRVLGKGALVTAYILFALAFGTIAIVLYSVVTSEAPPEILPSATTTTTTAMMEDVSNAQL